MVPRVLEPPPPELIQINKARKPIWNLYKDGVTQGFLQKLLSCPERARLSMHEGLEPIKTKGALAFGSMFHTGLHMAYSAYKDANGDKINIHDNLPKIVQFLEEEEWSKLDKLDNRPPDAEQELETMLAILEVLLDFYFQHWKDDYRKLEWLALEQEFAIKYYPRVRLGIDAEPIPVRGKWDGVYCTGSLDDIWLFETKTRGQVEGEEIVSKMSYELQVMLYLWALRARFGHIPRGVTYNVVRRPQLRRGVKEALSQYIFRLKADIKKRPAFYYIRYEVAIDYGKLKRWELEFDRMMHFVISWWNGAYQYRNSTACAGRMGRCEFIPICSRNDRSYYVKRRTAFPELEDQ